MEGEGEEVADGLCGGLSVTEGGGDLLERDGASGEALVLSSLDEGLGGGEEVLGSDEDVVGLVLGAAQRTAGGGEDTGREEAL